jgi:predicted nucleic-acid-binding Zn-ribbon protein
VRRGSCVKCGSATVRAARNGVALGEHAGRTSLRPHLEPGFRGIVRPHEAELWAFACATCGYLELHLVDPSSLAFIAQQWVEVPPAPPPAPA